MEILTLSQIEKIADELIKEIQVCDIYGYCKIASQKSTQDEKLKAKIEGVRELVEKLKQAVPEIQMNQPIPSSKTSFSKSSEMPETISQ